MRRLLFMSLFAIVLFCFGGPASGAIQLVQSNAGDNSNAGGTSYSLAFSISNSAGNLIIVSVSDLNNNLTSTSVSDTLANHYALAINTTNSMESSNTLQSQIYYAANIVGGTNTITVSFPAWDNKTIVQIYEYSGLATSSPLDQTTSNIGNSSSLDSGPVATTQANELLFGTGFGNSAGTLTVGTGYTKEQYSVCSGCGTHLGAEDRTVSSTGTYDATFTDSIAWTWIAQVATFKAAGAAGAPTCGVLDDGSTIYTPQSYTTFVPPAKMGTYQDPSFNCTVLRVTDGQTDFATNASHNYIRSALNADDSKFLALEVDTGNFYLVDVASGNTLVAPASPGGFEFSGSAADETWDRTNANIIYYEVSNNLKKADVSACTASSPCDGAHGTAVASTLVATLNHDANNPYAVLDNNNDKREISDDGCNLAMGGYWKDTTSNSYKWDAFVYDICTGTKSSVATCVASDQNPGSQTPTQFTSGMTHSNRVWVGWAAFCNDSSRTGTQLYDSNMNLIGQLFTSATPHSTAVYDPVAIKEYILFEASGSGTNACNNGGTSGIGKIEVDAPPPFPVTCFVSFPYNLGDVHVSSNNATGWFAAEMGDTSGSAACTTGTTSASCTANDNSTLPSNWNATGVWGHLYNEIIVGNISTGQIYRLAHGRSRLTGATGCGGYWTEPRLSMDFSGTRIAFDSSMARTNSPLPACIQDYVDTYVIKFR